MNKTAFYKTVCRCLCLISSLFLTSGLLSAKQQDEGFITFRMNEVPLQDALDAITEQSNYLFINRGVDPQQTVSIETTNATITEVCEKLFTPIRVKYEIRKSNIIISPEPEPDPVRISGTVLDQTGLPVPGAAVLESGTSNGTFHPHGQQSRSEHRGQLPGVRHGDPACREPDRVRPHA